MKRYRANFIRVAHKRFHKAPAIKALAIFALLCAPALGTDPHDPHDLNDPNDTPKSPHGSWAAILAQTERISKNTAALATAADQKLRSTAVSASNYLHRQAALASRMRGVHILDPAATGNNLEWLPIEQATLPRHLVLLIHGLDEPGRVWDDLAPALASRGHTVARFDYPNDQAIGDSADMLAEALEDLRRRGIASVDLIGHSKGGLVARDTLTRPEHYAGAGTGHDHLPDVTRLITLGTPHHGSAWARLQCLSEAAEHLDRWWNDPSKDPRHFLGFLTDGRGEAATDLLPGSAFLTELNAQPMPQDLAVTVIIPIIGPTDFEESWGSAIADGQCPAWNRAVALAANLSERIGDGVVSAASADLPCADKIVFLRASHRGVVRQSRLESAVRFLVRTPLDQPAAIPVILDRLNPIEPDSTEPNPIDPDPADLERAPNLY